jgi:quercetin dioxygenase-like cupin family protein
VSGRVFDNQHSADWAAIPEEVAPSGVSKRVLSNGTASLVMVRVPAGTKADRHSHAHGQFFHMLSGSGVLET